MPEVRDLCLAFGLAGGVSDTVALPGITMAKLSTCDRRRAVSC